MKISSYTKKLWLLFAAKTIYKKNLVTPQLYFFNLTPCKIANIKTILFALDNSQFMHLGDHLFFIPLIKNFIDSGYQVFTTATVAMRDLFHTLQLPLVDNLKPLSNYDLIISRYELISEFKNYNSVLVHVSQDLTMPICSQLLNSFQDKFRLGEYQPFDYTKLTNSDILNKLEFPLNKKLIIFNPYCDASAYLITKAKLKRLYSKVSEYSNQTNNIIVLTGSKKEKEQDTYTYPFRFVDLRGKTSVLDIFALVNEPEVIAYIGFDSFIMHVFNLLHKYSFVIFRGRITKKQSLMLQKYHVNLFNGDNFVTLF